MFIVFSHLDFTGKSFYKIFPLKDFFSLLIYLGYTVPSKIFDINFLLKISLYIMYICTVNKL